MKRINLIILAAILVFGFVVRLYKFDNPIADWHSWRQVDTSSVSKDFVNKGFDLLHPTYHDLSNVPTTGKYDNPKGYRFVEFPIYNLFQAGFYKIFGSLTLEEWGRIVTIFSSLISSIFIYLIVKRYADSATALFAAFLYTFIPYDIYYGRTILPDPMAVTATLGGIYFFDLWIRGGNKSKVKNIVFFILAIIFTASSFLLKPFALFFTLPMIAIAFNNFGTSMIKKPKLWIFAALTILPLIFWRIWMLQFPQGIPSSGWLLNGGDIRFKGAFFYWIFAERIGGLILGFYMIPLFIIGILSNPKISEILEPLRGRVIFFYSFLVSSLAYVTVVARGNVQHDYYQILIVPSLVIFAALGARLLYKPPQNYFNRLLSISVLAVCIGFGLAFRWYMIRDYFNINNPSIVTAGQIIDQITPKNALVIADYQGDTTFLYQTNRKGWASQEKPIPDMINMGADYLAEVNPSERDFFLKDQYKIVYSSDKLLLYDLHQPAGGAGRKP